MEDRFRDGRTKKRLERGRKIVSNKAERNYRRREGQMGTENDGDGGTK